MKKVADKNSNGPNKYSIRNKAIIFVGIMIATIFITRILVYLKDPNIFIHQLELHHFYYGLTLLIIVNLAMLFGRNHPKTYLISSAIAIGLILDESLFVIAKIRGPTTYSETLFSAQTLTVIVIVIIGIILFDIIGRVKNHRRK